MKIRTYISLVALSLFVTAHSTFAANILWTNTAGGNWSDTNSWSPNQTPGAGDVAVITNSGSYTVTLDIGATVSGLALGAASGTQIFSINGATFTLNGTAQVNANGRFNLSGTGAFNGNALFNGTLNCAGGTLSGDLLVPAGSFVNVASPGLSFNDDLFTNYGTFTWSGGTLAGDASPQIYNYGLWDAQSDGAVSGEQTSGKTTFNNFGTFRKSAGSGTTTVDGDSTFNNSGALVILSGTVSIFNGSGSGGTYNVAGGATFSLGDNFTFSNSMTFSGSGTTTGFLIGNNAVLNGALTASGAVISGALTLSSNSVLNIVGAGLTVNGYYGGGALFTNYGTVTWTNASLSGDYSPQIYNYGLWDAQADNTFSGQGSSGMTTFNNFGTFRKSAGTGTTTLAATTIFNNSGALVIQSGTLAIQTGTGSGTCSIAGGAILAPGNNYAFTNSTTFSGTGFITGFLNGDNAVLNGTLTSSGATMYGTLTLASNAVLNVATAGLNFNGSLLTNYGTLTWSAGNLNGDVSPQIYNYGLWDAQSDNTFFGEQTAGNTTFNNFGTFRKSAGGGTTTLDGNTIFNNSGALAIQSGTLVIKIGSGSGTCNIAAGAILEPGTDYTFTNSTAFSGAGGIAGIVIGSNATFSGTLASAGTTLSGALTLASGTVLNVGAAGLTVNGYPSPAFLTNYGTVVWSAGTLVGDNSPQIFNYGLWSVQGDNTFNGQHSTGTTVFNNFGTFRKSIATNTTTLDGETIFKNTGTVDMQSGTLNFAVAPALAGGTLNFGLNSASNFGKISIAGNAALTGTVSANLNNAFVPATNNSFAVIGYGTETGAFTATNLPASVEYVWQPVYGATAFSLNTVPPAPAQLVPTQSGGIFSFSFATLPGQVYQIQYTTNLAPANWINFGGTIQASNTSITVSNAISSPQLFYRAALQ